MPLPAPCRRIAIFLASSLVQALTAPLPEREQVGEEPDQAQECERHESGECADAERDGADQDDARRRAEIAELRRHGGDWLAHDGAAAARRRRDRIRARGEAGAFECLRDGIRCRHAFSRNQERAGALRAPARARVLRSGVAQPFLRVTPQVRVSSNEGSAASPAAAAETSAREKGRSRPGVGREGEGRAGGRWGGLDKGARGDGR